MTRLSASYDVFVLKLTLFLLPLATSVFYGLRLANEWGTDFGVYFVGGMSIQNNFGLYSGFFDHKGPTYYAFINIISWLVPYSKFGAILTLQLTCVIWFSAIYFVIKTQKLGLLSSALVTLFSISVLFAQPSNSSIAIFIAALQLVSISTAITFSKVGEIKWLGISAIFLVLAALARIDSIIIIPLIVYFICKTKKSRKHVLVVFSSTCIALFFLLLFLFANLLQFGLQDYWQQAILFNFSTYAEESGFYVANSHLGAAKFLMITFIKNGYLVLFVLLLTAFKIKLQNLLRLEFFWILAYGFFAYVLVGSVKDYHLFIFYVFLLIGVTAFFSEKNPPENLLVVTSFVLLLVLAISTTTKLASQSICLITQEKCYEPYSEVLVESEILSPKKVEFLFNQGWPYLFNQSKPTISFTPFFPLAKSIEGVSKLFIAESNGVGPDRVFWVSDHDIDLLRKLPNNLVRDFLANKILIATTTKGFSAYINEGRKQVVN